MSSDDHKDPTSRNAPGNAPGPDGDVHPDAPADARERARAASFAAMVDGLVAGQALPPAMTSDERALVETAGMVHASARPVVLAAERQRALIDSVLGSILGSASESGGGSASESGGGSASESGGGSAGVRGRSVTVDAKPVPAPAERQEVGGSAPADVPANVIDMSGPRARRRARFFRVLPWGVAAVSVAAALVLVLWQGRGGGLSPAAPTLVAESTAPTLGTMHRSRPTGALVGEIPRERADAARARIDMIYADRMIGYRDLRLRGGRL
jgi:hypothetical protein